MSDITQWRKVPYTSIGGIKRLVSGQRGGVNRTEGVGGVLHGGPFFWTRTWHPVTRK